MSTNTADIERCLSSLMWFYDIVVETDSDVFISRTWLRRSDCVTTLRNSLGNSNIYVGNAV